MAARRILLAATSSALALIVLAAAPADGATVTEFSQGIGGTPADLVAGPDGNIWYAQALFSKVGRLNLATGTATEFAGPLGTAGITVGPDQNLWVVGSADSGHKLDMVTTAGVVTSPITLAAAGEQVTLGPDGRLWVTESGGHIEAATVGTASPTGSFLGPGTPLGIVAGPDGNLWFTEKFGDAVGRITTAGAVTSFSTPTANSGPTFIARGPDGNLWFTELAANKIGRITTSGAISEFPLAAGAGPWGITAGPDGGVWFAEQALDRVGRIDPVTGAIREVPVPTPNAAPGKITVGPDGNLWVTEENVRKIARISAFFPPVATTGGAGSVTSLAAALAGTIDPRGDATSYRFDYGTTPGYGSSTPATSAGAGIGATAASARLAGLASATTYHYRLVATNSNGSSMGADHTFATLAAPATLSRLRVSPSALLPAARGGSTARRRARRTGATIRFALSAAGPVRFGVERAAAGRRSGKRCVAPTRRNRRARRCTRWLALRGTFTVQGKAGAGNTVHFTGRLRGRRLSVGKYRLAATPIGPDGRLGVTRRVAFSVHR